MSKVLLHDALQASYSVKKGEDALRKAGYKYDPNRCQWLRYKILEFRNF